MNGGRRLLSRILVLGVIAVPVATPLATSATASSPAPDDRRVSTGEQFVSSGGKVVEAGRVARQLASSSAPSYRGTNDGLSTAQRAIPSTTGAGGGSAAETPIAPDRRGQGTATTPHPPPAPALRTLHKKARETR